MTLFRHSSSTPSSTPSSVGPPPRGADPSVGPPPRGADPSGGPPPPSWSLPVTKATSGWTVFSSERVRPSSLDGFATTETELAPGPRPWGSRGSPPGPWSRGSPLEPEWSLGVSGLAPPPTGRPGRRFKTSVGSFFTAPPGAFFRGPASALLQPGPALEPFRRSGAPGRRARPPRSPALGFNPFRNLPSGGALAVAVEEEFSRGRVEPATEDPGFRGRSPSARGGAGGGGTVTVTKAPPGSVSPRH